MPRMVFVILIFSMGFLAAEAHDHIRPTMWGYAWQLDPAPDFPTSIPGVKPTTQLVKCPNGDLTFGPWHALVLYDYQASYYGWGAFLQERGS